MFKFNRLATARSFCDGALKIMMVVLGDDGLFWAVTPREARRLVAAGYELA